MTGLPTGTVTLLFSDMEGSTRLLTRLGDQYLVALDAQRAILRKAWSEFGGVELGTEGDSFYVVFAIADDAVRAVAHAQRELAGFAWPGGQPVRVRMGLHSGAPIPHDGAYVGIDVHRAARIAGSAHGGQIVVSAATAALVSDALADGLSLRDLGDHRFKDLDRPERVFQLEVEGLDQTFPPLRSVGMSSTLPPIDAALLGREAELVRAFGSIREGRTRLLTLTGPGGTGKTSLAVALARSLVDFSLAVCTSCRSRLSSTSPDMWGSIADVLGLAEGRDESDVTRFSPAASSAYADRQSGADRRRAKVAHRRSSARRAIVVVLATSRRPLHLTAEQEFPFRRSGCPRTEPGRRRPDTPRPRSYSSRQARRVRPGFELDTDNAADIAAICQRLDGVPLAIELAAARSKFLTPARACCLDSAPPRPVDGGARPADRHQTLRDTIEWSYQPAHPRAAALLRRLGVFVGGPTWTPSLPSAATCDDLLIRSTSSADIVDASLAQVVDADDDEPRITMLETIRTFAAEMLDSSAVRRGHSGRGTLRTSRMWSPDAVRATCIGKIIWRRGRSSKPSSRTLWRHSSGRLAEGQGETLERTRQGLRMVARIGSIWGSGGRVDDAMHWLRRAVERGGGMVDADLAVCTATLANYMRFRGEQSRP